MYGSDKRLSSSSTPTKRPQTPKDENEKSYQELGPNLQSPKISIKKHYMSPTISAASKVILPKRKILGENNQAFDNHFPKTPNIRASHESLSLFQKTPSRCNDLVETEQQNNANCVSDSASKKPYDPVKNCLSPRPQFLCHSSSRRREILRLRENEKIEGCDEPCISTISSFESKKEAGEENVLVEAQEDLIGSSTDGLGTEIASVGSPIGDSTAEEEAFVGAQGINGSIKEQDASVGAEEQSIGFSIDCSIVEQIDSVDAQKTSIGVSIVGSPNKQDASVGAQDPSSGVSTDNSITQEDEEFDDGFEEIEEARGWGLTTMLKFFLVLAGLVFSTSYISTMNSSSPAFSSQAINSLGDRYYFIQHSINQFGTSFEDVKQLRGAVGTIDEGIGEEKENADDSSGFIEPEDLEILDAETDLEVDQLDDQQNEIFESRAAETDQVCDDETVESEEILDEMAAVEKFESQIPIVSSGVGNHENNLAMEPIEVVVSSVETDQTGDVNLENEISMTPIEVVNSVDTTDQVDDQMGGTETTIADYSNLDIVDPEPMLSPKDELINVPSLLTMCAIVASFVFGFHFMKKQVQNSEKSKSILHNEEKEKTRSTYSFVKCQSIINPTELYESYTGDDVSSSMRSQRMKNWTVESEVSSQSYSQPAPSDCSYGSFTTEERIFRKKKDGDGYCAEISVTPVRRSSRIQNRAILSPRKLQYR